MIISAFPGIGKTWLFNHQTDLSLNICDSDSSMFSKETGAFPDNYIAHIIKQQTYHDIILVSSHYIVRDELQATENPYTLVYPDIISTDKECYIQMIRDRSGDEFADLVSRNWMNWIDSCNMDEYANKISINANTTKLSDVIKDMFY